MKIRIPKGIVTATKDQLDQITLQAKTKDGVHIILFEPSATSTAVTLKITGEESRSVGKVKTVIDALFADTIAKNATGPLWDTFFMTTAGLDFVHELNRVSSGYLFRDSKKACLRMYGPLKAKASFEIELTNKIISLQKATLTILLDQTLLATAVQGGFQRIVRHFGKTHVRLNVALKTITIEGSEEDLRTAQALLDEHKGVLPDIETKSNKMDCSVCWTVAEDPVHGLCNHAYCEGCFKDQCSSADGNGFPLRCMGDAGNCQHVFRIDELRSILSKTAYSDLLRRSFDSYVRTHPQEFNHCPTPDCPTIFRITKNGQEASCEVCLETVCTSCQVVAHEGLSCSDYKDIASEGTKAFQKWKAENGVKDCPVCKMGIEKTYGCNHMECRACGAHICWFCMASFKTGEETYSHMSQTHRTWHGNQ